MQLTASPLSRRLRAGETVYTAWCTLPAPLAAETIARAGFSSIVIDQQHGLWDTASTIAAIAAVRQSGAAAVVRVPIGAFETVSRVLDFGADAVIAPMINSADDARALVAAAKFPPLGERSWGPGRAMMLSGVTDARSYLRDANEATLTFAMIETTTALDNVEAIAATAGIDALFVGPWDLSIALSRGTAVDPGLPAVDRALDRVLAAAANAGKFAGLYCGDADQGRAAAARGFRFVSVGSDTGYLRAGASAQVEALKS
jgi:4-hydroxy-2-oxoheptanedioate aldolase